MKRICSRRTHGAFLPVLITAITINLFGSGIFISLAQATLPSLQFDVEHRVACVDVQNQPQFKVGKRRATGPGLHSDLNPGPTGIPGQADSIIDAN